MDRDNGGTLSNADLIITGATAYNLSNSTYLSAATSGCIDWGSVVWNPREPSHHIDDDTLAVLEQWAEELAG